MLLLLGRRVQEDPLSWTPINRLATDGNRQLSWEADWAAGKHKYWPRLFIFPSLANTKGTSWSLLGFLHGLEMTADHLGSCSAWTTVRGSGLLLSLDQMQIQSCFSLPLWGKAIDLFQAVCVCLTENKRNKATEVSRKVAQVHSCNPGIIQDMGVEPMALNSSSNTKKQHPEIKSNHTHPSYHTAIFKTKKLTLWICECVCVTYI